MKKTSPKTETQQKQVFIDLLTIMGAQNGTTINKKRFKKCLNKGQKAGLLFGTSKFEHKLARSAKSL